MADSFGRALLDHQRGERDGPLVLRDGEDVEEHPIEPFYFAEPDDSWLRETFDSPVLDLGAGAGRTALALQEHAEVVAIENREHLVETMERRGVEDARLTDMFDLRSEFEHDRFESALAIGTQVGLAGSMQGLRAFLGDLAHVTTPAATAVVDCYDPTRAGASELLGFRDDPTPGLAHRVMWFEYDGERGDALLFRLFSPDRLREAAVGTGWRVAEVTRDDERPHHYSARLERR